MLESLLSGNVILSGNVDYNSFVTSLIPYTSIGAGDRPNTAQGYRKTTMASPSGTMWGTPWGDRLTYDSILSRIAQHCFSNTDVLNESISSKRMVAFKFNYLGSNSSYTGKNRNGYSSSNYGTFNGTEVLDFLYFDYTTGVVMRVNPKGMSNPVTWNGKFI